MFDPDSFLYCLMAAVGRLVAPRGILIPGAALCSVMHRIVLGGVLVRGVFPGFLRIAFVGVLVCGRHGFIVVSANVASLYTSDVVSLSVFQFLVPCAAVLFLIGVHKDLQTIVVPRTTISQ
jgi:hypothetical protein